MWISRRNAISSPILSTCRAQKRFYTASAGFCRSIEKRRYRAIVTGESLISLDVSNARPCEVFSGALLAWRPPTSLICCGRLDRAPVEEPCGGRPAPQSWAAMTRSTPRCLRFVPPLDPQQRNKSRGYWPVAIFRPQRRGRLLRRQKRCRPCSC
jgi:hypothetical protein